MPTMSAPKDRATSRATRRMTSSTGRGWASAPATARSASLSAKRPRVSANSRAFSSASATWSAKVSASRISSSRSPRPSGYTMVTAPMTAPRALSGTASTARCSVAS